MRQEDSSSMTLEDIQTSETNCIYYEKVGEE